jgi:hypothetical protein
MPFCLRERAVIAGMSLLLQHHSIGLERDGKKSQARGRSLCWRGKTGTADAKGSICGIKIRNYPSKGAEDRARGRSDSQMLLLLRRRRRRRRDVGVQWVRKEGGGGGAAALTTHLDDNRNATNNRF